MSMTKLQNTSGEEVEVRSLFHLRAFLEGLMYASGIAGQRTKSLLEISLREGFGHVARTAARFVEFKREDEQTVPWSEFGKELKGAVHFPLLTDTNRVSSVRYELMLDSERDGLVVGCLVISWSYWLNSLSGIGVLPYFRGGKLGEGETH
jgi:hypothetical protein